AARAASAPVKATWLKASPVNTWPLSTKKYPTSPHEAAIPVPARKALRTNGCDSIDVTEPTRAMDAVTTSRPQPPGAGAIGNAGRATGQLEPRHTQRRRTS